MVFEPQAVVDGVNAILAGGNKITGRKIAAGKEILCNDVVTASYYLNPSIVKEAGIKGLTYKVVTKDYKSTRAVSGVTAVMKQIKDGKLTVDLNFNGLPSTGSKIDLLALQATNAEGEVITSDFATITSDPKEVQLSIAHKDLVNKASGDFWESEADAKTAAQVEGPKYADQSSQDARLVRVKYNETLDLKDVVSVCQINGTVHKANTVDTDHLSLSFEKVAKFELTGIENGLKVTTDQQQFAKLDGSVITPTTYQDGDQLRSSLYRTPVFKVTLTHNDGKTKTVVDERYIVVQIVEKDIIVTPTKNYDTVNEFDITVNATSFAKKGFCESARDMITAEQMNSVYSKLNVSKQEFVENYTHVSSVVYNPETGSNKTYTTTATADNVVTYDPNAAVAGITTTGLSWTVSAKERRDKAGKADNAVAVFVKTSTHGTDHEQIVVLNLTSSVNYPTYNATAKDAYKLPTKIASYWKADEKFNNEEVAQLNAFVPSIGETDETKCIFDKDLQELFSTKILDGIKNNISADYKAGSNSVTANAVSMRIKSATCTGYTFTVANNGTELKCNGEVVLTYDPTTNIAVLKKNSEVAKKILNTNEFYVTYTFYADYTTTCTGTNEVPNNGYPSFTTRYVRPLNASKPETGNFEDGLDFGTYDAVSFHTTILPAVNVIGISDWRGKEVKEGEYLFSYYGVKKVTCDNSQVSTDLTGTKKLLKNVTNTAGKQILEAGIINAAAWANPDLNSGLTYTFNNLGKTEAETYDQYFFYKNNGAIVEKEFNLYFPITIEYTWGVMQAETLKVTVKPTQHINVKGE